MSGPAKPETRLKGRAMLDTQGPAVKIRRPWVVGALTLVPFYELYWYYRINCEMRDYGRARGDVVLAASRPVHSILAVTLGAVVVLPMLISLGGAVGRVQACERLTNSNTAGALVLMALALGTVSLLVVSGVTDHSLASTVTLVLAIGERRWCSTRSCSGA